MTPSKQKRARPTIEPIKTSAIALNRLPRRVLTPSRCRLCASYPSFSTTEARFDSLNSTLADHCITPFALDSAKSGLSPLLPPMTKGLDESPEDASAVDSPSTITYNSCCARCGASPSRRQSASGLTAQPMTMAEFQRYREILWQIGQEQFGKVSRDAYFVFVVAEEMEPPRAAGAGEGPNVGQSSMADETRYPFRAVIRSGDVSIKLKRDFDMRVLRATIPEPIASPCSPNFDRSSLLAPFSPDAGLPLSPAVYTGPVTRRASAKKRKLQSGAAYSPGEKPQSAGPRPVPIHLPYARAHLPVLASIILSDLVRSGSTIQLPMPHPKAWAETAAYVYTGQEQLLSEQVKANMRHLGGKV
ncbi:hypothetical protein G6O67_008525 [Ophiocordyceps sinensis]|uniref:Uncharacterized protein n=2 Tax=Ophiocordyceps sinensis TaxID=72228 RepID=A0A8H4PG68_9HYPO|nr:hypothetical protein OCS_01517 [Ophiocordyceps sinensis CO18]KAF4504367.1 hypothetical protein G6O67_008525 [Ophiocordyceps sinensis]